MQWTDAIGYDSRTAAHPNPEVGVPRAAKPFLSLALGLTCLAATSFAPASAVELQVPSEYATIASALSAAQPGDVVEIAPGTYFEQDLDLPSQVGLRGVGETPSDVAIQADGTTGLLQSNPSVFSTIVIENLTLRGGSREYGGNFYLRRRTDATFRDVIFEEGHATFGGHVAGRYDYGYESLTFEHCVLQGGHGTRGGAIYARGATVTIRDSEFVGNEAPGAGGAVSVIQRPLTVENSTFLGNACGYRGGAIDFDTEEHELLATIEACRFVGNTCVASGGGAVCIVDGAAEIRDCIFEGNTGWTGGALAFLPRASGTVERNIFRANQAARGGGAWLHGPVSVFSENVFASNTATEWGGGFAIGGTQMNYSQIERNTVVSNGAPMGGGAATFDNAHPFFRSGIIAFSTSGSGVHSDGSLLVVVCTDVFGNVGGDWVGPLAPQQFINDNFSANPLFCDAASGDFSLRADSPCAAVPCGPVGALPVGCGAISVRATSWSQIKGWYRETVDVSH